jgi:hypothetical protein
MFLMGLIGFDLVAMFRGQSGNVKAVRVGRFLAVEAKPITANDELYTPELKLVA